MYFKVMTAIKYKNGHVYVPFHVLFIQAKVVFFHIMQYNNDSLVAYYYIFVVYFSPEYEERSLMLRS